MNKITIVVHGGAGPDSTFIKENIEGYEQGLRKAVNTGYKILEASRLRLVQLLNIL